MSPTAGRPIEISFDDNRRLPLLFGEHNANLTRIERQLGVKLATRGNVVSIAGPAGSAEAAWHRIAKVNASNERFISASFLPSAAGRPGRRRLRR